MLRVSKRFKKIFALNSVYAFLAAVDLRQKEVWM